MANSWTQPIFTSYFSAEWTRANFKFRVLGTASVRPRPLAQLTLSRCCCRNPSAFVVLCCCWFENSTPPKCFTHTHIRTDHGIPAGAPYPENQSLCRVPRRSAGTSCGSPLWQSGSGRAALATASANKTNLEQARSTTGIGHTASTTSQSRLSLTSAY